jgi:putative redox protein
MKIITKMIEEELYESVTTDGITDTIDMRALPVKKNMSPVESLLSALAACGAVDVVAMLRKRKKTVQSLTIETEGVRRETPPRSFTKIHCKYIVVSPDVNEEELTKATALSLEKYCSVADSLKASITFSVEVVKS